MSIWRVGIRQSGGRCRAYDCDTALLLPPSCRSSTTEVLSEVHSRLSTCVPRIVRSSRSVNSPSAVSMDGRCFRVNNLDFTTCMQSN